MSQNVIDFSGDPSGVELLDSLLTPMKQNILSNNSGTSRPSYAIAHTNWTDTTSTPWLVKYFDGSDDITIGYINATTNAFVPGGVRLDNTTATTNPTVNDDSADGYSVGSLWINNSTDELYFLADSGVGTAVWRKMRYDTTAYLALAGGTMSGDITLPTATPDTASAYAVRADVVQAGQKGGFINQIRNGTFDIQQRGSSGTVTAGAGGITTFDGWYLASTGANISWASVSASGVNMKNALSLTGNTSMSGTAIFQNIESEFAAKLAGKRCTIQFAVYNNTGASITPNTYTKYANSADNFGATTNDLGGTALQSCANGAWTTVAYVFDVHANAANGYQIFLDFGAVLNTNGKSVYIAKADLRITPGATLGLTSMPPQPEMRSRAVELEICKRYYQVFGGVGSGGNVQSTVGQRVGTNLIEVQIPLPVEMRANPTISTSSPTWSGVAPTGNTLAHYDNVSAGYCAITGALSVTGVYATTRSACFRATAGTSFGATAGNVGRFEFGPTAEIRLSSEL